MITPPKRRPRQLPVRKGLAVLYNRDAALSEAGEKERKAAEKRALAAEKFIQGINVALSAMELQAKEVPFTGQEYQQAGEALRQEDVQKWHDINKGFEAAIMAQLGTDLAYPLMKGGFSWLRNKAISPAAKWMMNPKNFTFEGPLIKPARLDIAEESIASEPFGNIVQTLFTKPRLSLPQPKLRLGLPTYNTRGNLDIAPQDAGLYDITDGDLAGIRLVDTALKPKISISPHSLSPDFMEHHTGNSVNSVVDNIYNVWNRNYPLWELEGIKPPLPFIASIGDDVMSVGFRPQWYKMIETPKELERMTAFAGPTRNKLIANLSPEAKLAEESRRMAPVDLFDEWLGPEARSPQQIAIDDEVNAFNKSWEDRLLFDSNVNSLYQNGLITPRHRQALLNSDEPLKYFNGAAQHNIMKKATQQYFKDIKLAKQKDYARRVMLARKEESLVNAGLNDKANAVYWDLQGTVLPPSSLNRQIADAENAVGKIRSIGDIVNETMNNYLAWKADPNPAGWLLKPLMAGNKLERQLSKDGTIAVSNLRNGIKDASDVEKLIIEKVLSEKFAGQTKVNYADLKHAVQEELPIYDHKRTHMYEEYGFGRLGYDRYEIGGELVTPEEDPLNIGFVNDRANNIGLDTYTFSTPSIRHGSSKHFGRPNAIGHSRTMVLKDEPDTQYVLESQSDWGQARYYDESGLAYNKQEYEMIFPGTTKEELAQAKQREKQLLSNEEIYLKDNFESRQILENMAHANRKGLTKMRYPTPDTAAKIEGYSKMSVDFGTKEDEYELFVKSLIEKNPDLDYGFSNVSRDIRAFFEHDEFDAKYLLDHMKEGKPVIYDENILKQAEQLHNAARRSYLKEHLTILRKYAEFPKKFKKIYKNSEVREVTDSKGNTWYEVDVPKDLRKRERAYSTAGTIIAGGTAASTLKPRKKQ